MIKLRQKRVSPQTWKGQPIQGKGKNPNIGQHAVFSTNFQQISQPPADITFKIYDRETFKSDDFVGEANYSLK